MEITGRVVCGEGERAEWEKAQGIININGRYKIDIEWLIVV